MQEIMKKFMELVDFMRKNKIGAAVMAPSIGSYQFKPYDISADELYGFMLQHFHDGQPESMRYYYTVHDYLMDLLEKSEEDTHA